MLGFMVPVDMNSQRIAGTTLMITIRTWKAAGGVLSFNMVFHNMLYGGMIFTQVALKHFPSISLYNRDLCVQQAILQF